MDSRPEQPAEGQVIEAARKRRRMAVRTAAKRAGMSERRWYQIVNGFQNVGGQRIPVTGPAGTIARMAQVVGVMPEQLRQAEREDAAEELSALPLEGQPDRMPTMEELVQQVAELQAIVDRLLGERGEERGA